MISDLLGRGHKNNFGVTKNVELGFLKAQHALPW